MGGTYQNMECYNKYFDEASKEFIKSIHSLKESFPLVMAIIEISEMKAKWTSDKFAERYGEKVEDEEERYWIPPKNVRKLMRLEDQVKSTEIAYKIIPQNFIVSLVSQFDSFLGDLMRIIFGVKPEILNASKKTLNYSQILEMGSITDIKEYIIEKEVESFLRKSHVDHFDYLENRLGMPLREGLNCWPIFIEVTERRNLFAHCNGVITNQYLSVCRNNNVDVEDYQVGDKLKVDPKYFRKAYKCIFEIGIKLNHVIWRKLVPEERYSADTNLNNIIYDLIVSKDYDLAIILSEFATSTLKRFCSKELELMFLINKAQAYKWNNNNQKCIEIIDEIDWSAYGNKFKLAYQVLKEDYEKAAEIMFNIGKEGEIGKLEYKDWPLFKKFVKTEEFLNTYSELFDEDYEELTKDEEIVLEGEFEKNILEKIAVTEE